LGFTEKSEIFEEKIKDAIHKDFQEQRLIIYIYTYHSKMTIHFTLKTWKTDNGKF
jgi:hypothetical protein